MDKLLHTSLFRAILKSLNRKVVSEKRLQTYFLKFASLITALCDDTDCLSALHTLNYTQIQFRFLLSRIHEPSVSLPPYIHRVVDMTLEFICLEKELLYHRIEHPRSFLRSRTRRLTSVGSPSLTCNVFSKTRTTKLNGAVEPSASTKGGGVIRSSPQRISETLIAG